MRTHIFIFTVLITACLVTAALFAAQALTESTPTPNVTHTLAPDPTPTPTEPTPLPYSGPITLSVKATATMKWSPTLEPADFVNIFQLVDPANGYYANGGTQYDIAHSYAAGSGAPGNAWEKLVVGDVISYGGGNLYRVNLVATPAKGDIGTVPVWGKQDPNMLVLITCESRGPGHPATNNMVIRLERL